MCNSDSSKAPNLDAACTLAQEEAVGHKDEIKSPASLPWMSAMKTTLPLPLPPKTDKLIPIPVPAAGKPPSQAEDSKLSALKAYHRALGLCYKCGMKWSQDHKCSADVLHAVQELWESMAEYETSETMIETLKNICASLFQRQQSLVLLLLVLFSFWALFRACRSLS